MNFRRNIIIWTIIIITVLGLAGCGSSATKNSVNEDKPIVAVSIVPQKTFVKAVAGDLVDVVTMIPPGNSPANYQPSPKEMENFSRASIYFTIGVPTEKANILPKAKDLNSDIRIVDLAEEVGKVYPYRYFGKESNEHHEHEKHEEEHRHYKGRDPHIWLSPKRVKVIIEVIANELGKLDPENKKVYEKNAKNYIEKLDALDREIKEILSEVESRAFIVYHPAFGYFAEDYNLQMIPIEKEGKKATPKELQKIIDIAKEKNIKVVFYQEEIDSAQAKALAEEVGGRPQKVAPLAPNYIENLRKIAKTFKNAMQ